MANHEEKEKKGIADEILRTVDKIIPGFGQLFKKGEKTKTFGPQMKKIREEIKKRFGGFKK